MLVELKKEWMGHPKGSTVAVAKTMAMRLTHMGTAVPVGTKPTTKVAPKTESKAYHRPTKDKMVKTSVNK